MPAAEFDFTLNRGGTRGFVLRLRNENSEGVRTPIDLTGSTFILTISWPGGSLVKSTADGGLGFVPENGEIRFQPAAAETKRIPQGRVASYELEWRLPGGGQVPYMRGKIIAEGGLNSD